MRSKERQHSSKEISEYRGSEVGGGGHGEKGLVRNDRSVQLENRV